MYARFVARSVSVILLVSIACFLLAACGGGGHSGDVSSASVADSDVGGPEVDAQQLLSVALRRLAPNRVTDERSQEEGRRLGIGVIEQCALEQGFWSSAKSRAVSPLIGRRHNTYLLLVGAFATRGAAVGAFRSLTSRAHRNCYHDLIRKLFVLQLGGSAVEDLKARWVREYSPSVRIAAGEIRTRIRYRPATAEGSGAHQAVRESNARIGIMRAGSRVYWVANFRWGRPGSDPVKVFDRIVPVGAPPVSPSRSERR
jgi:hypothetical protein